MLSKLKRDERQRHINAHLEETISCPVGLTSLSVGEETNSPFHHLSSNPLLITTQASNRSSVLSDYDTDSWYKEIYLFSTKQ